MKTFKTGRYRFNKPIQHLTDYAESVNPFKEFPVVVAKEINVHTAYVDFSRAHSSIKFNGKPVMHSSVRHNFKNTLISLNYSMLKLSPQLINAAILHELGHTKDILENFGDKPLLEAGQYFSNVKVNFYSFVEHESRADLFALEQGGDIEGLLNNSLREYMLCRCVNPHVIKHLEMRLQNLNKGS